MATNFDFNEPITNVDQPFEEFVKEAEKDLEKSKKKSNSKPGIKNILMFILALNIIGLGVFGFLLTNRGESGQPNRSVAGVQTTTKNPQVITGNNFSIVSKIDVPKGYVVSTESLSLPFLEDKEGAVSRYLIDDQVNGQQIKSGFEMFSTEYDNKLDINQFTNKVKNYLGEDYTLDPKTFTFAKNIPVKKIVSTQGQNNVFYYATVTSDNYYLIKVFNQTLDFDSLSEYTDFINSLESTLYLN